MYIQLLLLLLLTCAERCELLEETCSFEYRGTYQWQNEKTWLASVTRVIAWSGVWTLFTPQVSLYANNGEGTFPSNSTIWTGPDGNSVELCLNCIRFVEIPPSVAPTAYISPYDPTCRDEQSCSLSDCEDSATAPLCQATCRECRMIYFDITSNSCKWCDSDEVVDSEIPCARDSSRKKGNVCLDCTAQALLALQNIDYELCMFDINRLGRCSRECADFLSPDTAYGWLNCRYETEVQSVRDDLDHIYSECANPALIPSQSPTITTDDIIGLMDPNCEDSGLCGDFLSANACDNDFTKSLCPIFCNSCRRIYYAADDTCRWCSDDGNNEIIPDDIPCVRDLSRSFSNVCHKCTTNEQDFVNEIPLDICLASIEATGTCNYECSSSVNSVNYVAWKVCQFESENRAIADDMNFLFETCPDIKVDETTEHPTSSIPSISPSDFPSSHPSLSSPSVAPTPFCPFMKITNGGEQIDGSYYLSSSFFEGRPVYICQPGSCARVNQFITWSLGGYWQIGPTVTSSSAFAFIETKNGPTDPTAIWNGANQGVVAFCEERSWNPTLYPSMSDPSKIPTISPSESDPSTAPSPHCPSKFPIATSPSKSPSSIYPSNYPSSLLPSLAPISLDPSTHPISSNPTILPTTTQPSVSPSLSLAISTLVPTSPPTESPTVEESPCGTMTLSQGTSDANGFYFETRTPYGPRHIFECPDCSGGKKIMYYDPMAQRWIINSTLNSETDNPLAATRETSLWPIYATWVESLRVICTVEFFFVNGLLTLLAIDPNVILSNIDFFLSAVAKASYTYRTQLMLISSQNGKNERRRMEIQNRRNLESDNAEVEVLWSVPSLQMAEAIISRVNTPEFMADLILLLLDSFSGIDIADAKAWLSFSSPPTFTPSFSLPSFSPSFALPSKYPLTASPTISIPSHSPSYIPSLTPSFNPISSFPSDPPSEFPTHLPTPPLSKQPSTHPVTSIPSLLPSIQATPTVPSYASGLYVPLSAEWSDTLLSYDLDAGIVSNLYWYDQREYAIKWFNPKTESWRYNHTCVGHEEDPSSVCDSFILVCAGGISKYGHAQQQSESLQTALNQADGIHPECPTDHYFPYWENCPNDISGNLTSGAEAIFFQWEEPHLANIEHFERGLEVSQSHYPGASFRVGQHSVTYTAVMPSTGFGLTCTFSVEVISAKEELHFPYWENCPNDISRTLPSGAEAVFFEWEEPHLANTEHFESGIEESQSHYPGAAFRVGQHSVTYTAVMPSTGFGLTCSFSVEVIGAKEELDAQLSSTNNNEEILIYVAICAGTIAGLLVLIFLLCRGEYRAREKKHEQEVMANVWARAGTVDTFEFDSTTTQELEDEMGGANIHTTLPPLYVNRTVKDPKTAPRHQSLQLQIAEMRRRSQTSVQSLPYFKGRNINSSRSQSRSRALGHHRSLSLPKERWHMKNRHHSLTGTYIGEMNIHMPPLPPILDYDEVSELTSEKSEDTTTETTSVLPTSPMYVSEEAFQHNFELQKRSLPRPVGHVPVTERLTLALFELYDTEGTGEIDFETFHTLCYHVFPQLPTVNIHRLFKSIRKPGTMTFDEYDFQQFLDVVLSPWIEEFKAMLVRHLCDSSYATVQEYDETMLKQGVLSNLNDLTPKIPTFDDESTEEHYDEEGYVATQLDHRSDSNETDASKLEDLHEERHSSFFSESRAHELLGTPSELREASFPRSSTPNVV